MAALPVLFVAHRSELDETERGLLDLLWALDRGRFEAVLACPPGPLAQAAEDLSVEVRTLRFPPLRAIRNPFKVRSYALAWTTGTGQLRRVLHETGAALTHAASPMAQALARAAARKAGIPSIWHARDLRPIPFPARGACWSADRVIAASDAVAAFLSSLGLSRLKVTRVYDGIHADGWRSRVTGRDVTAEMGLPTGSRVLLVASALAPWNRHEDAIRALPRLLRAEPAARLVLAGIRPDGEDAGLLANLRALCAELGVEDEVMFADRREDLPDLMARAEVVVIPSDAEPSGRVALEAMALGKPVVGTRAGGLPEVVRDGATGLLVVPRFPESLADACLRLLKNPSLADSLGRAARAAADEEFHIARAAQEIQDLYEATLHPPLKWRWR